jgi:hypothetical protein
MRKSGISNQRSHELRETANSGICRKFGSEVANGEIHEPVRSKVKVVVSKSPGLECELVAGLSMYEMKKTFLYVFTLGIFFEFEGVFGM